MAVLGAPRNPVLNPSPREEEYGGMLLGHPAYPAAKAKGDHSRPGTRTTSEGAYGRWRPQDPPGTAKAGLLEPQSPVAYALRFRQPRPTAEPPCPHRAPEAAGGPSTGGPLVSETRYGDEQGAYPGLGRSGLRERGMDYGARALGPRSRRSSQRPGKPATGRRAAGSVDLALQLRYA